MNDNLRAARLTFGLTQHQLASHLGTSHVSIWRWERGDIPSLTSRQKICAFFQRNEADLGFRAPHVGLPGEPVFDATLPPLSAPLVGRSAFFDALKQRLIAQPGALSLSGLPGMGKTSLLQALAAELEIRQAFPDGILWMQLGEKPRIGQCLARWARLLQGQNAPIPSLQQPFSEDASRLAWGDTLRELLSTRRMLLIFDDVWSMQDLLACQIGGARCSTLFTTRFPRIASCATETFVLPELTEEESFALLSQYAAPVEVPRSENLRALLQSAGGHPQALLLMGLAIRIEGHTGQTRRMLSLIDRLMKPAERLHLTFPAMFTNAPINSLFETISTSERALHPEAREALLRLARWYAARTIFSEEELTATRSVSLEALDQLIDAGLLESRRPGWYRLHPVVVDYAHLAL
jgi:transcriptional regulator with XRE-family HTH domain